MTIMILHKERPRLAIIIAKVIKIFLIDKINMQFY